jgi:formyltetrahydrofolate-dependent phosphoribosylglycinamide formyltransferase
MNRKRIAILASGSGSNAEALLRAMQAPGYPAQPVLVLTNRPGAGVLAKAARFEVPSVTVDHKAYASREAFDKAVVAALKAAAPDLICLAGYMRILTPVFLNAFGGKTLNIHPALLPKHGGPGMYGHHVHEAVVAADDKESGATVHWVTQEVDGGAIILQERVPLAPGDDARAVAAKVLAAEHRVYPEALRRVCLA